MSPLPNAVDRRLPPPSIESPLHLVPLPLVLILCHRFMDLTAQTGRGPLHMIARVRGTPSVVILAPVAVRMNVMRNELFLATPLPTGEGPVIGSRLLEDIWTSQASPPRPARSGSLRRGRICRHRNGSLHEGHPLLSECASLLTLHSRSDSPLGGHLRLLRSDSPHGGRLPRLRSESPPGGHLRLPRGDSPQRGHHHPSEWESLQTQGLAPPGDPCLGSHVLQGHNPPGIPSLQREVPLPLNDDAMSRGTHHHHSSRASSREPSQGRPHSRSSPNLPPSPSQEEKEADETSMPPKVKAMVDILMKSFPEATASLAHPSSRSFDLSASAGVSDPATPSGSLLAWCQVMSDSFQATQKRFTQKIQEGKVCHTLLPALHRFERVSNSPTQGRELRANPDLLDLLQNKVPDFCHLPISIKEGVSLERSLRSMMETHSFLTWSVMGLIKSLHEKKLLPKDDPVISQLQKSFSKACSSMATGLTSNTAFVTMKRRQLLLSHVVPSVTEAQKRNLLSDPFFQTGSLFDASSVKSARSAACDLSLFKPHLQDSTSKSKSRRQPYSGSSNKRDSSKQASRPSSPRRSPSPFRQQSGRKGDPRFYKKSSGAPQKRGGFRK